jgi:hypothetical protein
MRRSFALAGMLASQSAWAAQPGDVVNTLLWGSLLVGVQFGLPLLVLLLTLYVAAWAIGRGYAAGSRLRPPPLPLTSQQRWTAIAEKLALFMLLAMVLACMIVIGRS